MTFLRFTDTFEHSRRFGRRRPVRIFLNGSTAKTTTASTTRRPFVPKAAIKSTAHPEDQVEADEESEEIIDEAEESIDSKELEEVPRYAILLNYWKI